MYAQKWPQRRNYTVTDSFARYTPLSGAGHWTTTQQPARRSVPSGRHASSALLTCQVALQTLTAWRPSAGVARLARDRVRERDTHTAYLHGAMMQS